LKPRVDVIGCGHVILFETKTAARRYRIQVGSADKQLETPDPKIEK